MLKTFAFGSRHFFISDQALYSVGGGVITDCKDHIWSGVIFTFVNWRHALAAVQESVSAQVNFSIHYIDLSQHAGGNKAEEKNPLTVITNFLIFIAAMPNSNFDNRSPDYNTILLSKLIFTLRKISTRICYKACKIERKSNAVIV